MKKLAYAGQSVGQCCIAQVSRLALTQCQDQGACEQRHLRKGDLEFIRDDQGKGPDS
jgi:hypothetical protein